MLQNPHVLLAFDKVHNPVRLPRKTASERPKMLRTPQFFHFWLRNVLCATTVCTFSTSQLPKVVRTWCVLYILTSKCASRHNGVHFLVLRTRQVFFHFLLRNVLRATTACTFSTSQLPKVVRTCGVFNILTSKCASRHNGVQFFISHLPSGLRTRRFSEPTFRPSGATNHCYKTQCFATFPFHAPGSFFFRLSLFWSSFFFSSLLFSSLPFSSLLWLLPPLLFLCPHCRKFDF